MVKTTIDGLAVRSLSNTPQTNSRVQTQRRVSSDFVVKKQRQVVKTNAGRRAKTVTTESAKSAKRRRSMSGFSSDGMVRPRKQQSDLGGVDSLLNDSSMDDFLSPVSGFDLESLGRVDNSFDGSFATAEEADWSDLLAGLDDEGEEESDEKPRRQSKKGKKVKKKRHIGRKIFATMFILLCVAGGALYVWGDSLISKLTNGNSGLLGTFMSLVSDEVPFETDANGRTNVLVFGTEGYNMAGDSYGGVQHDGSQLTDSIMVISFDQKTKDIALLSLPRDLKVSMACSAGKINEVYWCHNQDGNAEERGAQALMSQIGQILGIELQYWAHVNWASVVDIVNTLGGITVTLDEDIADYYNTGVVIQAGVPTNLNGDQAVALARARYGTNGGDFTRGNSQQKIVEGIANKLIENGIGFNEALGLLNILGDNLRTNFSSDNIKSGIGLLAGFNVSNIRSVPLVDYNNDIYYVKTATINNVSYVIPSAGQSNYSQIQQYIRKSFSSNPAMREGARIAVFNSTGGSGVASAERAKLENDGFEVLLISDAATEDCSEKFCVFAVNESMTGTKAALEQRYQTTVRSAAELPADIWPGEADFVVVIGLVSEEL